MSDNPDEPSVPVNEPGGFRQRLVEILAVVGVLGSWIALDVWVFPRRGVPT